MATDGTLHLTREIPVPRSVSTEAQATMAAGCAGVAARLESPPNLPDPSDRDAWRERIAAMDELMVLAFQGRVAENMLDVT